MARTDIAAVLDDARDTAVSHARDLAATTIDAASSALDTAGAQGKELSKRARKQAKELSTTVQEKAGRKPKKRGRKLVILGGVALAGVAIATVVSKKKAEQSAASSQSELPSDRPGN